MAKGVECGWLSLTILLALFPALLSGQEPRKKSDDESPMPVEFPIGSRPATRTRAELRTWLERQNANVVMQKQDYSCGAAALATIGRYYFRDPVTERQILDLILKSLSAAEIKDRQDNGLSMDDLFMASEKLGYQAAVARLPTEKLDELEAPVIVRIIKDDYKHFVVVRGVVEDRIWLADPIRGNVRMPVDEFLTQWNGVALFLGKEGFGLPKAHGLSVRDHGRPELQPVRQALSRGR